MKHPNISHWNHRVVRRSWGDDEYSYGIHEVYYNVDGSVSSMTKDPTNPRGEDIEELKWSLKKMTECLNHPVLDYETLKEL